MNSTSAISPEDLATELARIYWYAYLLGAYGIDPDAKHINRLVRQTKHHDRFTRPARRILSNHSFTSIKRSHEPNP